ncbi:MAG: hypothetical protein ABJQ71_18365 [Roseibium sp.]
MVSLFRISLGAISLFLASPVHAETDGAVTTLVVRVPYELSVLNKFQTAILRCNFGQGYWDTEIPLNDGYAKGEVKFGYDESGLEKGFSPMNNLDGLLKKFMDERGKSLWTCSIHAFNTSDKMIRLFRNRDSRHARTWQIGAPAVMFVKGERSDFSFEEFEVDRINGRVGQTNIDPITGKNPEKSVTTWPTGNSSIEKILQGQ